VNERIITAKSHFSYLIPSEVKMNRKKKINDTLKKRQKKANAKLQKSNKPRYISKAEREKLALAEQALKDSQAN